MKVIGKNYSRKKIQILELIAHLNDDLPTGIDFEEQIRQTVTQRGKYC